jgi:flavin-dependent dehydrogenase
LVDPFSGEGIRFAVKSGRLAAEAILSGRIGHYSAKVYHQIGLNHTFAAWLGLFYYHFPGLCFTFGVRNPIATYAFMDMFSDRAGYLEVFLRLFGSLPVYFLTESVATVAGLLGGQERRNQVRAAIYSPAND